MTKHFKSPRDFLFALEAHRMLLLSMLTTVQSMKKDRRSIFGTSQPLVERLQSFSKAREQLVASDEAGALLRKIEDEESLSSPVTALLHLEAELKRLQDARYAAEGRGDTLAWDAIDQEYRHLDELRQKMKRQLSEAELEEYEMLRTLPEVTTGRSTRRFRPIRGAV